MTVRLKLTFHQWTLGCILGGGTVQSTATGRYLSTEASVFSGEEVIFLSVDRRFSLIKQA